MKVDLVVNWIILNRGLKSIDFEILADKIVELFPRESKNTYYVPRIKGNSALRSRPVNARGKLVDKYRNLRKLYNVKILNGESREEDIHLPAATGEIVIYIY